MLWSLIDAYALSHGGNLVAPFTATSLKPGADRSSRRRDAGDRCRAERGQAFRRYRGESENVSRINAWTVGVVGGLLEGSFLRFAAELGKALDDGENLRVLPIVSYGAVENVNDLLYLRGVDIAITNADVFSEFRKTKKPSNIEKRINYISSMYVSEVHVFARPEIKTLQDLEGKTVSLGKKGAGQTITGPIIFERLGIKVNFTFMKRKLRWRR